MQPIILPDFPPAEGPPRRKKRNPPLQGNSTRRAAYDAYRNENNWSRNDLLEIHRGAHPEDVLINADLYSRAQCFNHCMHVLDAWTRESECNKELVHYITTNIACGIGFEDPDVYNPTHDVEYCKQLHEVLRTEDLCLLMFDRWFTFFDAHPHDIEVIQTVSNMTERILANPSIREELHDRIYVASKNFSNANIILGIMKSYIDGITTVEEIIEMRNANEISENFLRSILFNGPFVNIIKYWKYIDISMVSLNEHSVSFEKSISIGEYMASINSSLDFRRFLDNYIENDNPRFASTFFASCIMEYAKRNPTFDPLRYISPLLDNMVPSEKNRMFISSLGAIFADIPDFNYIKYILPILRPMKNNLSDFPAWFKDVIVAELDRMPRDMLFSSMEAIQIFMNRSPTSVSVVLKILADAYA